MEWFFSEQENYLVESFMSLTFIVLLIGMTSLTDKKEHTLLSILLSFGISLLILGGIFLTESPLNSSLRTSSIFLIGISWWF